MDPNTPIGPDTVIVRVGAEGANLKGRGHIKLWPLVHVIMSKQSKEGRELAKTGQLIYPAALGIRWQDNEKPYKPGDKKHYIALYEPSRPNVQPWVLYRVPQEDRETFESLRSQWRSWYLRIEIQGMNVTKDFLVASDGGTLEPTTMLDNAIPEGADKLDRKGMIERLLDRHKTLNRETRMGALLKEDHETNEKLSKVTEEQMRRVSEWHTDILEKIGGPLPWVEEEVKPASYYKIEKDDHKLIVENYLQVISTTRAAIEAARKNKESEGSIRHGEMILDAIKRAHIFELTYESYSNIYRAADVYTTETVASMKFRMGEDPDSIPEEEKQEHERLISEAGRGAPFPDRLPFGACWFAIGRGRLALTGHQAFVRGLDSDKYQYRAVAILITEEKRVMEVLESFEPISGKRTFEMVLHRKLSDEEWQFPYSLMPWIVLYLIEAVNDHHTTLVNGIIGTSERLHYERASKKLGMAKPIPAPYYTVIMRDQTIKLAARRVNRHNRFRWSYSHRFDRRGCEAMNIERGPLPMPEETRMKIMSRGGYRIFDTPTALDDADLMDKLRQRRQPLKSNTEWLAIKTWWRNGGVVGDESLPYVPSTRKGTKGVLGFEDTNSSKAEAEAGDVDNDDDSGSHSSAG